MSYISYLKKSTIPKLQALYDDYIRAKDPHFFAPYGIQMYCGRQGSGKTISAVKHSLDVKKQYPNAYFVSNLLLNNLTPITFYDSQSLNRLLTHFDPTTHYIYFQSAEHLSIALTQINNSHKGVIYLIDEIHTYFNALESKNIPIYVFAEISQQRKQRKLIIGTSQLFMRVAKPFREQCDHLIMCNTRMGFLTTQRAYDPFDLQQDLDGHLIGGKPLKRGWFFQTRKLRDIFDTYQKVEPGNFTPENLNNFELTIKNKKNKINLSGRK